MLNFLLGKKIETLFENTISNNMQYFMGLIKDVIAKHPEESITEEEYMEIHAALIQNIVVDITNFMKGNPFSIFTKYQMYMMSPSIVEPFFAGEPMSAAILYCIVYYAYTGKKAKSVIATKQNHVLHAYTTRALHEIDEELSKV